MGPTWGPPGPAPCWPLEPYYQGRFDHYAEVFTVKLSQTIPLFITQKLLAFHEINENISALLNNKTYYIFIQLTSSCIMFSIIAMLVFSSLVAFMLALRYDVSLPNVPVFHYVSGIYGCLYIYETYVDLMWYLYLFLLNNLSESESMTKGTHLTKKHHHPQFTLMDKVWDCSCVYFTENLSCCSWNPLWMVFGIDGVEVIRNQSDWARLKSPPPPREYL